MGHDERDRGASGNITLRRIGRRIYILSFLFLFFPSPPFSVLRSGACRPGGDNSEVGNSKLRKSSSLGGQLDPPFSPLFLPPSVSFSPWRAGRRKGRDSEENAGVLFPPSFFLPPHPS